MKPNSRRKQKLSSRFEEESTMSSVSDPFLCADIKQEYVDGDTLMNANEWGIELNQDTSLLGLERSGASSLDLCATSDLYNDDLVDAILGDMDFNNQSPLFLEDPTLENNDVFNDVRYTSTPKSRPLEISNCNQLEPTKKRPHFHVLHDITDSINCANNESFINISHVLDTTPPGQSSSFITDHQKCNTLPGLCTPPPSASRKSGKLTPGSGGRKVGIIRKRLRSLSFLTPETSIPAVSSKKLDIRKCDVPPPSMISHSNELVSTTLNPRQIDPNEEGLSYYSGINSHQMCTALLKFIKLPSNERLSTFNMQMITLMKLRLDLEWKDIAFRYITTELLVKEVFNTTLTVFSECLIELLPWHVIKKVTRKNPKTFYVHLVQKHGYQTAVIIGDGRKPINYVSSAFPVDNEPLSVVLNECYIHLVIGDVFCLNDTCYRIAEEDGRMCAELDVTNRLPNITSFREVASKMMSTYPLLSLEPYPDISKVMITVGALTNINYMATLSVQTLSAINKRSLESIDRAF
ncbi:hypothetical protein O3M35_010650 [Rhynocoris fuscipes]|uniref:Uncharacterized protein n=1 Tax=Rhynocoris fuscipes TaxID=488301 RepID=A0AAW1D0P9_9HEMI